MIIAVAGTLPYIALQLKAVALSVTTLLGTLPLRLFNLETDTALVIALVMAAFAVLFGTRHIDATEHQEGLIVAVAAESLVKLAAFLTVGFFVIFSVFGGIGGFTEQVVRNADVQRVFANEFHGGFWLTVTFLTKPEPDEKLAEFYKRVRPGGPGWRRVAERLGLGQEPIPGGWTSLLNWGLGILLVYAALFGIGQIVFGRTALGLKLLALGTFAFAVIMRNLRRDEAAGSPVSPA